MEEQHDMPGQPADSVAEPERCAARTSPGLTANALKLIAIIAMVIDHTASYFLDPNSTLYIAMRFVGRITGPTMFFMVAQGYRHTRDANRYTLRLLIFAVVSYLPFHYAHSGYLLPTHESWYQINVIYTILIGLLAIRVRNEWKNPVLKVAVMFVLLFLAVPGDWGVLGFLMMLAFDYFHGNFKNQAVAYCMIVLTYGNILTYLLYPWQGFLYNMDVDYSILIPMISAFGMFLPIILLSFYNGRKGSGGAVAKWGFYVFYPAHLLLIALIKFVWMA